MDLHSKLNYIHIAELEMIAKKFNIQIKIQETRKSCGMLRCDTCGNPTCIFTRLFAGLHLFRFLYEMQTLLMRLPLTRVFLRGHPATLPLSHPVRASSSTSCYTERLPCSPLSPFFSWTSPAAGTASARAAARTAYCFTIHHDDCRHARAGVRSDVVKAIQGYCILDF